MKILVVSNEQNSANSIVNILKNFGHNVLVVVSTEEALSAYKTGLHELVIVDVLMPVQDSYKSAEMMRKFDKTKNIGVEFNWVPIIFVSNSAYDIDINQGVLSGGDDYIVKPVTELKLHTKLFAFSRMLSMQKHILQLQKIAKNNDKMEALSILSAGVAHEIRNPLGTLMQGGQNFLRRIDVTLLKNKQIADEIGVDIGKVYEYVEKRGLLKFIDEMQVAGGRIVEVIKGLLSLTSNHVEKFCLNNINLVLESAIQMFHAEKSLAYKLDAAKIIIIKNFSDNLPMFFCCRSSLQTVFNNLLLNSAYALNTVAVAAKITITTKVANGYVEIVIEDNGIGIKQKNIKNLFAPFFTTKEIGQGMGLGLTVAYGVVVSRHSGEILVESTEGIGAKFIVRLPIKTQ